MGAIFEIKKGPVTEVHSAIGSAVATGVSTSGSPVVTGLTGHAFKEGDVVTVDKGFASASQTVISVTATTVTVGNNSNASTTVLTMGLTSSVGEPIDCRGFNLFSIECIVSDITAGNWLIEPLGNDEATGTFGELFKICDDGSELQLKPTNQVADGVKIYYFPAICNYIKIRATRTTDGTLTCKITPFNV